MIFLSCNSRETDQIKICRCCLSKEFSEAISTDFNNIGKRELYENMLKDVFNIQILHESQSLYMYICKECISRLQDASSFKEMVLKNEETYLECLQRHEKEIDLKIEEIKKEVPTEVDYQDDSYDDDDDEILANLKFESNKDTIANVTLETRKKRRRSSEKTVKSKRTKKKDEICDIDQHKEIQDSKLAEHRGKGPILREHSLRLLAHSTASVFQWNKSRYQCFCCKEPFSDINLLISHTNSHSLGDIQKKIINQQNRLVKVEISHLNCKLCNKKLKDLDNLREHLVEHDVVVEDHLLVPFKIESKLKCQICLEPFALFRLLNIHMNKHYQKHVCYVCGAGFSNLVFLNLHRTRSHRPIQCQKCNIHFVSRMEKKLHDTEVHGLKIERKNRFPCPFCTERFFQENLRVLHLVEKHGMKKPEFSCQFCSKSFITKSLLNNHVKVVHMKEKNHECDVCHNLFYTKSDVARHRVTHTGEKNYACSLCSNPFASKDSLRRHMKRTHVVH